MKQVIGAQGEITIIKIERIPDGIAQSRKAERTRLGWIISHSESGHHHVLTGGDVLERTDDKVPEGMQILYALLDGPAELVQDADTPHGKYELAPGAYEFRISREYDPFAEQARRVAD